MAPVVQAAVLEAQAAEVEQKPGPEAPASDVMDDLGHVRLRQRRGRLQFDDHVVHHKICPIRRAKGAALVGDGHWDLPPGGESALLEFHGEGLFVRRFQQAWPQLAVDFHGSAYDPVRERVIHDGATARPTYPGVAHRWAVLQCLNAQLSYHNVLASDRTSLDMEAPKWSLALLLACPSCAGTFFVAMAGAAGVGALAFKSVLLAVVVATVAVAWSLNAWRRRGECAWPDA